MTGLLLLIVIFSGADVENPEFRATQIQRFKQQLLPEQQQQQQTVHNQHQSALEQHQRQVERILQLQRQAVAAG